MKPVISSIYGMGTKYSSATPPKHWDPDKTSPSVKKHRKQALKHKANQLLHIPPASHRALEPGIQGLGVQYRRCVIIEGGIADFFFPDHNLIVQIDSMWSNKFRAKLLKRDTDLLLKGFRTLRVQAKQLFNGKMPDILASISAVLRTQKDGTDG